MAEERPVLEIKDGDKNRLHAGWSRSGKRLILSILRRGKWDDVGQVELTPAQVEELKTYLEETLPQ
jgi:hypothetical protein